jgi:enterochelin esterase-like enzyme
MVALRGAFLALFLSGSAVWAQEPAFRWVNPMPEDANARLEPGTYHSELMGLDVGYVVYLPPGYEEPVNAGRSYPVVYHLPGGRVGSEVRSIFLADLFDEWIRSGTILPRIYVFVNGGPEGYFDYGDSRAESSFVKELIPHIDQSYRTIDDRPGRALEGFSMGGRGAARIAFKYPELFCSTAPMSGGHQKEELMSESGGREERGAVELVHEPTDNSWDLARLYAERSPRPELNILVAIGTDDPNYQGNLDWMEHLRALGIPFEERVAPGVSHDLSQLLEALGPVVEVFHDRCFATVLAGGG